MSEQLPETFKERLDQLRETIKVIALEVNKMHQAPIFLMAEPNDPDEMHANLTLSYRHLEDARMRLGKALQAQDGGKSIYDQ